ncbi:hypothetical protein [Burkholderia stagnalis]|uniref:hypothetical protein n=1 Tax=Burkholderia stagnalis TaxID=1503054 RepID=UPI000F80A4C1|nr:hypothetical protein [Burkholderia stagnalis]
MSAKRGWIGVAAVMIFYLAIVILAEIRASSTDSMSVTVTDGDGRQRCTVESVFIGDGAIRGRRECQQVKQGH